MVKMLEKAVTKSAVFAQGSFWGPEGIYAVLPGVQCVTVGYTGGKTIQPTYDDLDDHTEAISIEYNPKMITYEDLLAVFWKSHDSTVKNKSRYKSAIYWQTETERKLAEESKIIAQLDFHRDIVTEILPLHVFYSAENCYQKFALRSYSFLFDSLGLQEDPALLKSHVITRVNGYLSGYGSVDQFDQECFDWGLKAQVIDYVRGIIEKRKSRGRLYSC